LLGPERRQAPRPDLVEDLCSRRYHESYDWCKKTVSSSHVSSGKFLSGKFSPGKFSPGKFSPENIFPGKFSSGKFPPGKFFPGKFFPGKFFHGKIFPGQFPLETSDAVLWQVIRSRGPSKLRNKTRSWDRNVSNVGTYIRSDRLLNCRIGGLNRWVFQPWNVLAFPLTKCGIMMDILSKTQLHKPYPWPEPLILGSGTMGLPDSDDRLHSGLVELLLANTRVSESSPTCQLPTRPGPGMMLNYSDLIFILRSPNRRLGPKRFK
jgi:hypothetical protein